MGEAVEIGMGRLKLPAYPIDLLRASRTRSLIATRNLRTAVFSFSCHGVAWFRTLSFQSAKDHLGISRTKPPVSLTPTGLCGSPAQLTSSIFSGRNQSRQELGRSGEMRMASTPLATRATPSPG